MAYDRDNIFARILRGEVPAHRVYEDEYTLAFLDVMPQSVGHTLVIPKAEAENLFELDPEMLAHVIRTTQKVAAAVRKAFSPPGVMIAQLNGAGAGQSVFHLHFHVIPRYHGIDLKLHAREMEDGSVLAERAAKVRAALESP
ncbi:MAG TPA: HIT family protein [Steroidobacteraceae bacterium]|nr:HIT family protein [Steroidobacteraceae bacterium]